MLPKFSNKNLILVDVDALRRSKPRKAIDVKRVPPVGRSAEDAGAGDDNVDPLAAVIALARRKTRR
jgi:hypothetical protein